MQVSREQAIRRVVGDLRADAELGSHCCTLAGFETESPHKPEHHTFIHDVSMVARQSLDDTAACCGAIKTNPAWAAEPLIQVEVDLLEHSQGVNSWLHLPENVVDAVQDAEITRDWSAVEMDEKMNKWQKIRLREVLQELQGRRTRR